MSDPSFAFGSRTSSGGSEKRNFGGTSFVWLDSWRNSFAGELLPANGKELQIFHNAVEYFN